MLQSVDVFCLCVGASMPLWALRRSLESCKLLQSFCVDCRPWTPNNVFIQFLLVPVETAAAAADPLKRQVSLVVDMIEVQCYRACIFPTHVEFQLAPVSSVYTGATEHGLHW